MGFFSSFDTWAWFLNDLRFESESLVNDFYFWLYKLVINGCLAADELDSSVIQVTDQKTFSSFSDGLSLFLCDLQCRSEDLTDEDDLFSLVLQVVHHMIFSSLVT